MGYLLFPFRWLDERVQEFVDASTFRLMRHLRCERRVIILMLALIGVASLAPIFTALVATDMPLLHRIVAACIFVGMAWNMLSTHAVEDRRIHPWRFYVLERAIVAFLKVVHIGGFAAVAAAVLSSVIGAPMAACLLLALLAMLGNVYLQRTPKALPEDALLSES